MKLYEISAELQSIMEKLETWSEDHETDIEQFPLADYLEAIKEDFDKKCLNVGCLVKDFEAEAEKHAAEARTQTEKKRSCERRAESLRQYLLANIEPGTTFEDARCKLAWRKSEGVKVSVPVMNLPEEYIRFTDPAPRLDELKKAIKAGAEIAGVELEIRHNLQIK